MVATSYALGLGSNRRHGRYGRPDAVLTAAVAVLAEHVEVVAQSATQRTAPMGPGTRRYANAALIVRSDLPPPAMLALAKRIERDFGRRQGRRWGDRVLDIDLLLWSGGGFRSAGLTVPHAALTARAFALLPLIEIAPGWPLPRDYRRVRHLAHAVDRRRPRP